MIRVTNAQLPSTSELHQDENSRRPMAGTRSPRMVMDWAGLEPALSPLPGSPLG